jgi:hypothetical protein
MSFAGAQGGDLAQAGHDGSYSYYLELENCLNEPASGSLNIPWLAGLMISQGNAQTEAIARNAAFFSDVYGEVSGGGGESGGYAGMGSSSNGLIVSW